MSSPYLDWDAGSLSGTVTATAAYGSRTLTLDLALPPGAPTCWFSYLEVDDVDKRIKKVKAAGGAVMREPWDVPTVGRIAIVKDSGGAVQGWMEPAPDSD